MKKIIPYVAAFVLTAFGLLTLFLSSSVIFDWFGIRAKEGNYVLFIVWTNFISSLLYLAAAYGFVKNRKWTTALLTLSLTILIIAFLFFKGYIDGGGIHEEKTIGAMFFRTGVTLVFTVLAYFTITKTNKLIN